VAEQVEVPGVKPQSNPLRRVGDVVHRVEARRHFGGVIGHVFTGWRRVGVIHRRMPNAERRAPNAERRPWATGCLEEKIMHNMVTKTGTNV
jgi:hypothetical protein